MDGRDIGTTVCPKAEVKICMRVDRRVGAKPRLDVLSANGFIVTMDEVYRNIQERDHADTTRSESPLVQAPDAILLDNSHLDQEEQLEFALNEFHKIAH